MKLLRRTETSWDLMSDDGQQYAGCVIGKVIEENEEHIQILPHYASFWKDQIQYEDRRKE